MKLKSCPWCKEPPRYKQQTRWLDFDDNGTSYRKITELPVEIIECSNVKCKIRSSLTRVNTNDAIEVWNGCRDENK